METVGAITAIASTAPYRGNPFRAELSSSYCRRRDLLLHARNLQSATIFDDSNCPVCVAGILSRDSARRPFKIDAIVLLPDHLHCIWKLPRGDHGYSQRWSRIKAGFTTRYLENGGSDCDVSISRAVRGERGIWQRRFFEHLIRDDDDLKRCADYIHINPVKHGLVKRVRDWPWSSFHRYVKLGEYPLDWGGSHEFYGDEWLRFE